MYALVALLSAALLYLAYEAVREGARGAGLRGGLWRYGGLALAGIALIYTHNWGLLVVVAVNVWWALVFLLHPPARRTLWPWLTATSVAPASS